MPCGDSASSDADPRDDGVNAWRSGPQRYSDAKAGVCKNGGRQLSKGFLQLGVTHRRTPRRLTSSPVAGSDKLAHLPSTGSMSFGASVRTHLAGESRRRYPRGPESSLVADSRDGVL